MLVRIVVTPNSHKARIEELPDGRLRIFVMAKAKRGEANDEVRELISVHLGVPREDITIVRGRTTQGKTVRIAGR